MCTRRTSRPLRAPDLTLCPPTLVGGQPPTRSSLPRDGTPKKRRDRAPLSGGRESCLDLLHFWRHPNRVYLCRDLRGLYIYTSCVPLLHVVNVSVLRFCISTQSSVTLVSKHKLFIYIYIHISYKLLLFKL